MGNHVNNEEYAKALKDKDNVRIMKWAARRYSKWLGSDVTRSCLMFALLRALKNHDYTLSSFSNSLVRFVVWECRNALRKCNNLCQTNVDLDNYYQVKQENALFEYIDGLPEHLRRVVQLRFESDCNFQEIAHIMGVSKTTVFDWYTKALKILRETL